LVAALVAVLAASGCYHQQTAAAPAQPRYAWVQGHYYWDSPSQKWLWRDGYWAAGYQAPAPQETSSTYVGVGLGVGYYGYGYPWGWGWGPYYGYGSYYGGYPYYRGYASPRPYPSPVYRPPTHARPNYRIPSAPRGPTIRVHPPARR
jgi:hypothetical protein